MLKGATMIEARARCIVIGAQLLLHRQISSNKIHNEITRVVSTTGTAQEPEQLELLRFVVESQDMAGILIEMGMVWLASEFNIVPSSAH